MNKPIRNWGTHQTRTPSHVMLNAAEELALVLAWQQHGDQHARDNLVAAFAPMAASMAKRAAPGQREPDPDLVQQANIGLMKAADRFDPDRGFRFSTYAVWWVRAEIQDFKFANLSVVRRPRTAEFRKVANNLARIEAEVATRHNLTRSEADDHIAQALSISKERLRELRMQVAGANADSSLNVSILGEEGEERMSLLADPASVGEDEGVSALDTGKLRKVLLDALRDLPDREREIVVATQLSDPPSTLDVLGDRFGVSKERVRQLRERGLERLRDTLRRQNLAMDCFV
ncbi:sigma-70 family RNA polymerase sigma factor [Aestuariivita sp.]|jgi:RNA polymerase sigma-32 factor|uniref:sigma-70 family RNA polymerase sigma factor n=1 Tax=Aestuariivita sp. TaxID=1872407 RepID=UPI00216EB6F2|nr:sigma-70 family RNA polymerase sigma factor [Aestuariivita sp.]MCE8008452.1 sigma-70 family RNA polymerase sigma factor [Aestuariivita sp.]